MNRYAIGDLHGRYDLLVRAVAMIQEHRAGEPAELVMLGDYVDRGPQSCQVLKLLKAIEGEVLPGLKVIVLKGNHEDMTVEVCEAQAAIRWWVGNGGGHTLRSYGYEEGDNLYPLKPELREHIDWLKTLPLYYETEHHVFVHGGMELGVPIAEQKPDFMLWHCYDRVIRMVDPHAPHADTSFEKHVVHGHEQWKHGPILLNGRTDLDTFAWRTGRLAIGVFNDKQDRPVEILWAKGPPA